jgi:hypothetical protein
MIIGTTTTTTMITTTGRRVSDRLEVVALQHHTVGRSE